VVAWFGLGSFALCKIYTAEQFPTRLRGLGTSTAEMVTRALTGGLLIYFLPSLFARWGGPTVFIACAVAMVVLLAPIVFFGHETSGRNMEVLGTPTAPRMASAGRPMSRGQGQVRSNIVRHR
jgi:putative MFS transporter